MAKKKQVLNSTREFIVFVSLFLVVMHCFSDLYFPNNIEHCVIPKSVMNISQQLIMLNMFILLRLVHTALNKTTLKMFFWITSLVFVMVIFALNIYLLTDNKNTTFLLLEHQMSCVVQSYSQNKNFQFLIIFLPVLGLIVYAIFIFVKGNRYFKNFPEKTTKILRQEIVYFPLFIMFTYTPKLLKHYRRYIYQVDDDLFLIFIWDKFNLGIMGLFICFAFIWKRKGFNPKQFFDKKQKFDQVTEEDLDNFSYFN